MRELSYIIVLAAVVTMLVAGAAWFRIHRNPKHDLTKGGGGKPASVRLTTATTLTFATLGLSASAAIVAVIGWS